MNTDQVFKTKFEKSADFKFDTTVVNVFDDMVVRSVPIPGLGGSGWRSSCSRSTDGRSRRNT
jgi:hypothetical protein